MFYIIYQTTNCINGKKYIGKHCTNNINDDYLGSGLILSNAIKKYGKQNFTRQILFVFESEEEMNNKEIELITPDIVLSEDYYNLALGGKGGAIVLKPGHPLYDDTRNKISIAQSLRSEDISRITKQNHLSKKVGMYGKQQSEHQKQTVSKLMKGVPKNPDAVKKQLKALLETLHNPNYVHPNKGRKRDQAYSIKVSEMIRNRPLKTCPHCNKSMNAGNYARYHGDKCKNNKNHV